MSIQKLSTVTPDFDKLHAELRALISSKNTWQDALPTSIGTAILDMFAGLGVQQQFALETAFREAFPDTAYRESSIYAITRLLGNKIARKLPATTSVKIQNPSTTDILNIPRYTELTIDGKKWYNKQQITLMPSQLGVNIPLYQGEFRRKTFDLTGINSSSYYEYILDEPGFGVSDTDLVVYIQHKTTNQVITFDIVSRALWEFGPDIPIVYESTLGNGDVSLVFGNGKNGLALTSDYDLIVEYIWTEGADILPSNPGVGVTFSVGLETYKGETVSNINTGSSEKDSSYYKQYNGVLARSRRKGISKTEIKALVSTYPGVADSVILTQRDVAPYDLRWMNIVRICVLPDNVENWGGVNPNPKSIKWDQFRSYLEGKIHSALQIQTWNAEPVYVDIILEIGVYPRTDIPNLKQVLRDKINLLFKKTQGTLGHRLAVSDIIKTVNSESDVDYVKVVRPTEDIVPIDALHYVTLGSLALNVFLSERVSPSTDIPNI